MSGTENYKTLLSEDRESIESSGLTKDWIPLIEYAVKTGVSLSTLRRHIKSNKVEYRVENGRYFLLNPGEQTFALELPSNDPELRVELQRAHEEIAELKTLIAFYEEQSHQKI